MQVNNNVLLNVLLVVIALLVVGVIVSNGMILSELREDRPATVVTPSPVAEIVEEVEASEEPEATESATVAPEEEETE